MNIGVTGYRDPMVPDDEEVQLERFTLSRYRICTEFLSHNARSGAARRRAACRDLSVKEIANPPWPRYR
jgi:hypothetical protein